MKKRKGSIVRKSLVGIIIPLVLLGVIACIVGYNSITNAMSSIYQKGAIEIAETAKVMIDGDRLGALIASNGETEEYAQLYEKMDSLCNTSGATFIYVICPNLTDYNHITFIISTINKNSNYSRFHFGYYRQTTNDDYKTKYRKLYEGESDSEIVIRDKGYIETEAHITAMVPIKDSDGRTRAILCVQRQMDAITTRRSQYVQNIIISLLIISGLIVFLQSRYLKSIILNPLTKISAEASRFASDGKMLTAKALKEDIARNDEIGTLAESIDRMEKSIVDYVKKLTTATAEKERISTELNLATRIQSDMLPNIFPCFPDRKEFDIYASMDPAKEVGGDFYDFFFVDDDHLCLVVADVSGKGIPAALFMMASKITIANNAMMGKSPAQILMDSNKSIYNSNKEEMFVTVWIGILEVSTGRLVASNAGHEYPVIKGPNGKFELYKDKHGMVVGGIDSAKYTDYEITLKPGSKLFLYSDGVPEATNANGAFFGCDRMINALNSEPDADPQHILINVRKAVDAFEKGADQFDDITMMCVEYRGPIKK
ncbi:MAG: SpoIIE family protein phosphatase [Spirochaetales bacterium]